MKHGDLASWVSHLRDRFSVLATSSTSRPMPGAPFVALFLGFEGPCSFVNCVQTWNILLSSFCGTAKALRLGNCLCGRGFSIPSVELEKLYYLRMTRDLEGIHRKHRKNHKSRHLP